MSRTKAFGEKCVCIQFEWFEQAFIVYKVTILNGLTSISFLFTGKHCFAQGLKGIKGNNSEVLLE